MLFPNSSAMDATASGGGPITVLPQIVTGQPEQIAKHVLDLLHKAAELTSLYTELSKAADQLGKVWSGGASESALQKISHSLDQLTKIINVIEKGAELLGVSGTLVKAAQEAYRSVVAAVNPTVASLMSNWWTYGAAVALSTATSATLRGFITAVGGLLKALGAGDLANQITQVATIIGDIEKLFHHGSSDASGAAGNAAISGTPVSAPQLPAPVASASGQAAIGGSGGGVPGAVPSFTNYTPPALSHGGGWSSGSGTGAGAWPSGGGAGAGANPGNSWIPVDPAPAPAPAPSVPGQSTGAHEVVIHTDLTTGKSTVEAPAGQDVDIDVDVTYQGKHFQQHVDIDAKGA
ncbi:WXG100 family type VII secretion target [Amycolatopsis sp. GA6-003]|uniref:WXG100 family type VII secretion target n=1 Tax=Amycolatopsis sp. GA6-003 TaxID=2652444 RepID=UPI003916FA8C